MWKANKICKKLLLSNVLVLSDSNVSITRVTHTDFKLVAETWQWSTSLCAVCTECTTTSPAVMLHSTHTHTTSSQATSADNQICQMCTIFKYIQQTKWGLHKLMIKGTSLVLIILFACEPTKTFLPIKSVHKNCFLYVSNPANFPV